MPCGHVNLLNTWGAVGGNDEGIVGHFCEVASVVSRQGDGFNAHLLGHLDGPDNVSRVSTSADTDSDVSFFPQGHNLLGEDLRKTIIVADAGEDGGIRAQGDGGKGRTLHEETVDKLCGEVLGLRCAASVAEEQDLVPVLEGIGNQLDDGGQSRKIFIQEPFLDFTGFLKPLMDNLLHESSYYLPRHILSRV